MSLPLKGGPTSIAVVILNYNGLEYLRKFLPNVVRFSDGATIVVVDNGSTDSSIDFLKHNFPSVDIIDNGANLGFCRGYNESLGKVKADYVVLLNNDVEVTEGWLPPLKNTLDSAKYIAAVQPKILSYKNRDEFEYAGAGGGLIDILGYPFCRGRIFDTVEKDRGQYNDTTSVFWASGACIAIRAKLFRELGGFDEDFFAHMEEIDLCWRLRRREFEIYYCGSSTVYHVGGGTLTVANPNKTYYNFRNGLAMLIKHQSVIRLLWKMPLRIILDWLAALKFLLGSPKHCWAVVRAHWYVFTHLGRIFSKRREMKGYSYDVGRIYPGIMIFRYFLLGKKTYQ
jgi:GT2 family glycosyltransferase